MLNAAIERNHKYIKQCARNICRVKNALMADDLISETYLRVVKWTKLPPTDEEIVKVFVAQMTHVFKGERSGFNKLYNSKEKDLHGYKPDTGLVGEWCVANQEDMVQDPDALTNIYLNCEQTNEATKELIEVFSHLNNEMAKNYVNLHLFKESLPGWDKEIFHQYFELGMSSRDIAKGLKEYAGYDTNYQRINELINQVKAKIEEWKQLNS